MTTITIEKELLDRALESMCWAARILNIDPDEAPNYHWSLENIRSALAAPATAPDELERLRKDAERYRFIRDADRSDCIWREICIYAMETLDEYVDAAMEGENS